MEELADYTISDTEILLFCKSNRTIKLKVFSNEKSAKFVDCSGIYTDTGEEITIPHEVLWHIQRLENYKRKWQTYDNLLSE